MGKHLLKSGKDIIKALCELGSALNYVVETELPIEKDKPNAQAIDVAWLSEKGQEFPLMIFEVESKVTNSIANNPVKVFGKPNQKFEKPLFFFHIMVTGGADTSRIEDLRTMFGSHNYRIYKLAEDDADRLFEDVLMQHRRLTSEMDLLAVIVALNVAWATLDLDSALVFIEKTGFERGKGTFLPRYAELSQRKSYYQRHFLRYLKARDSEPPTSMEVDAYPSYLGRDWSLPIHLGILATSSDTANRLQYFERLCQWQEHYSYLTMIGPHLGLSWDYDNFIFYIAPTLWALIAVLMSDIEGACEYISRQCRELLIGIQTIPDSISMFSAVWMLHISAGSDSSAGHFEFARQFVNERGGLPKTVLYEPPAVINPDEDPTWYANGAMLDDVPSIEVFRGVMKKYRSAPHESTTEAKIGLAIDALMDDATIRFWAPQLINYLH